EERFKSRRPQCPGIKREEAEPRDILGLLRPRGERPRGCRAAKQRYKLAPPHVGHRASSALAPVDLPHVSASRRTAGKSLGQTLMVLNRAGVRPAAAS